MELCRCLVSTFVDILWERCPSLHARRRAPVSTRYADRLNSDNNSAVRNVPPRRTGSPARPGRQSSAYVAAAPGRRHDHHAAVSPPVHPTLPAITNLSHLHPARSLGSCRPPPPPPQVIAAVQQTFSDQPCSICCDYSNFV